jgi:hypothetical protein
MPAAIRRTPLPSDAALSREEAAFLEPDFLPLDVSLTALEAKDRINPFLFISVYVFYIVLKVEARSQDRLIFLHHNEFIIQHIAVSCNAGHRMRSAWPNEISRRGSLVRRA